MKIAIQNIKCLLKIDYTSKKYNELKMVKKNLDDYKQAAINKGGQYFLSIIPKNISITIEGWQCINDHKWKASYNNISNNNSWCPQCSKCKVKVLDDYKKLAIEKEYEYILNEIPETVKTYVKGWRCGEFHIFNACYGTILANIKCTECTRYKPRTLEDYKKLGIEKGYEYILDIIPETTKIFIAGWKCTKNNHIWNTCYSYIQSNIKCSDCSLLKPKILQDYKDLAIKNSGEYILNEIPQTTHTSIEGWKCNKMHIWSACFKNISSNNSWCPKCQPTNPKVLQDYKDMALIRNGEYIFDYIPKNTDTLIKGWKCNKNNHIFETCYGYVQGGNWCSECSGIKAKVLEDYKKIAIEKGGEYILNIVPKNSITTIKGWKCKHNHIFTTCYGYVQQDSWCPHVGCRIHQISKIQFKWLEYVEENSSIELQHALNGGEYKIPETKYKVDGYHQESNTCYEFHGCFWHGCPRCKAPDKINPISKLTFKELYDKTITREKFILSKGYKLVVMWECDFRKLIKQNEIEIEIED